MKNIYLVLIIEEDGKKHAFLTTVTPSTNLYTFINRQHGVYAANIYPTKKQATWAVEHFNAMFKINGVYMFDNPQF